MVFATFVTMVDTVADIVVDEVAVVCFKRYVEMAIES